MSLPFPIIFTAQNVPEIGLFQISEPYYSDIPGDLTRNNFYIHVFYVTLHVMSIVYSTMLEPEEIEQFREHISRNTTNHNNDLFSLCTLWNGPVNRDGYGFVRVTFRGRRKILTAA